METMISYSTRTRAPGPRLPSQQVRMGQLKIGVRTDQLEAVLGSCVGIALIWKKAGRCGLAHCLLPEAPVEEASTLKAMTSARYVSLAVPALLRLMGAHEADYPDIEAVLAGGANMLDARSQRLQVGQQNAAAARKYLQQCGLTVSYCSLGGKHGRTMHVDCAAHCVTVRDIVTEQPH